LHLGISLYANIWPNIVIKSQDESRGISTSPVWQWQGMAGRLAMVMVFISVNNKERK
jgi:hypothetical protein